MGRRSRYPTQNAWRERVSAYFVEYWAATKAMRAIDKSRDESGRQRNSKRTFQQFSAASRLLAEARGRLENPLAPGVWQAINASLDGEGKFERDEPGFGYAVSPEASGIFRTLVFLKHGMTFRMLIAGIEKDRSQYEKLIQVHRDYYRFVSGQLSMSQLKLKFNLDHFTIIVDGLDFGLDSLNETELSDCFDEICPCSCPHSGEYLTRLRARIKKVCREIIADSTPTSWPTS